GKVVSIRELATAEPVGAQALQISNILSIFSVHVQRVPADARVSAIRYRAGKYLAAFRAGASEQNEHAVTHLTSDKGKFAVRQIAGAVARRVICHMEPNQQVRRGDRLGYIRFGSRVELVVPVDFRVAVSVGQRVRGGVSVMGYFAP
ncbi:MAG: phosphatidylserine decarboxylase, partial [Candidatus Neomarinimicrobiota bacterium]